MNNIKFMKKDLEVPSDDPELQQQIREYHKCTNELLKLESVEGDN